MELHTFTATPVRSYNQLESNEMGDINVGYTTLDAINKYMLKAYPEKVAAILSNYDIDGFTIYPVTGYWQGEKEQSFKIEIAGEFSNETIAKIAFRLKQEYNQDAVMYTAPNNNVAFL